MENFQVPNTFEILLKTGQLNEAGEIVKEYFETFPNDLRYSEVAAIQKRLAKHWIKPDWSVHYAAIHLSFDSADEPWNCFQVFFWLCVSLTVPVPF